MTYPKWVQRDPNVGAVLCQNEAEEKKLLDDWKSSEAARERALKAPPVKEKPQTLAELRTLADSLGIKYTAQSTVEDLHAAIETKANEK